MKRMQKLAIEGSGNHKLSFDVSVEVSKEVEERARLLGTNIACILRGIVCQYFDEYDHTLDPLFRTRKQSVVAPRGSKSASRMQLGRLIEACNDALRDNDVAAYRRASSIFEGLVYESHRYAARNNLLFCYDNLTLRGYDCDEPPREEDNTPKAQ